MSKEGLAETVFITKEGLAETGFIIEDDLTHVDLIAENDLTETDLITKEDLTEMEIIMKGLTEARLTTYEHSHNTDGIITEEPLTETDALASKKNVSQRRLGLFRSGS